MGRAQSAPLRAWHSRYIASTAEHSNKWGSLSRPTLTQIMNFKNRGLTFLNCIKLANLLTLKLNNCLCVARDPRPEEIDLATRTSFLPYAATSAEWAGEQAQTMWKLPPSWDCAGKFSVFFSSNISTVWLWFSPWAKFGAMIYLGPF